jgi:hypothetical protein
VIRLEPIRSTMPLAAQAVVPSACPWTPWSVAQTTWAVFGSAVPAKLMVLCAEVNVAWEVGDVMATAPRVLPPGMS